MDKINMENLEACIVTAIIEKAKYIAIKCKLPYSEEEEIIINPTCNFEDKLHYYQNAYNENLELKTCNDIKITGFTFGNSFEEINRHLFW